MISKTPNSSNLNAYSLHSPECIFLNESESRSVVSDCLWSYGLYSPWNSPGQKTGVGSHSLLQGIFPIQGSNPGLPHCGQILYQLSHQGSPRILEWIAIAFSSGSFRPKNWTGVSCITHGFFTSWATRETQILCSAHLILKTPQWGNFKLMMMIKD